MTTATMTKGGANVHLNDKNYVCTTKSRLSLWHYISKKSVRWKLMISVWNPLNMDSVCVVICGKNAITLHGKLIILYAGK